MSWKTPITLLVLLGVLLGAAYYGWQTVSSPSTDSGTGHKASATSTPKCKKKQEFHKGQKIQSKDVLVNVYNAGAVAGLAGSTLSALHSKGFPVGVADNAPSGVGATNVTILTADKSLPQVQLVASQFKGRVAFRKGAQLAAGIDVIVGDGFVGMRHKAKRYVRLHHSVSTCTAVKSASR